MSIRKILSIAGPRALVNVYRDSDWNEYRVSVAGSKRAEWYFTPDRDDAEDTAAMMAGISAATRDNYPCPGYLV